MLILSRRPGQSIKIGDNVWIKVLDSKNGEARLGITAPDEVNIKRSEIIARDEAKKEKEGQHDL
jgi:carbon storage regulator